MFDRLIYFQPILVKDLCFQISRQLNIVVFYIITSKEFFLSMYPAYVCRHKTNWKWHVFLENKNIHEKIAGWYIYQRETSFMHCLSYNSFLLILIETSSYIYIHVQQSVFEIFAWSEAILGRYRAFSSRTRRRAISLIKTMSLC